MSPSSSKFFQSLLSRFFVRFRLHDSSGSMIAILEPRGDFLVTPRLVSLALARTHFTPDNTHLYHDSSRGRYLIHAVSSPGSPVPVAANRGQKIRSLAARGPVSQISPRFEQVPLEKIEQEERRTRGGTRLAIRRLAKTLSPVFAGVTKIVHQPREGSVRISFFGTPYNRILSRLEEIAGWVDGAGLGPVLTPRETYKFHTRRVAETRARFVDSVAKPRADKKYIYHILDLETPREDLPTTTSHFTPLRSRKVVALTDRELREELCKKPNIKSLLRSMGISTTKRRPGRPPRPSSYGDGPGTRAERFGILKDGDSTPSR